MSDPVEEIVADALNRRGIRYQREGEAGAPDHKLDFHLPDFGVAIEVKRFATPRSAAQLERHDNTILIQGIEAARAFAAMLAR